MKARLVVAALVTGLAASPAWAQDADEKHFDGPRIEALFGYDQAKLDIPTPDDVEDIDSDAEDLFYGAAIGYDFQSGMFTVGAEAEIAGSGLEYEESVARFDADGAVTSSLTGRIDSAAEYYVGARVGFVGGRSLFYLKAGYAMSGADIDVDSFVDGVPASFDADIDLDGLRLGAGYEYKLTDLLYVKAEYRFTDFSGADLEMLGQSEEFGDIFETVNLERHQAVVGVGVRF